MIDYYKWYRENHGHPTDDQREGRPRLLNDQEDNGDMLPIPLAVAPNISIPLMLEFLHYTFEEIVPSTGKPRRANEKVRELAVKCMTT